MFYLFDRQQLIKNFKEAKDKIAFAKIFDKFDFCVKTHEITFTDFMDPNKIDIFRENFAFIQNGDVEMSVYGGFSESERSMIAFYPSYAGVEFSDFPIEAIKISYNSNFSHQLDHREVLGAIISLGLDRGKLGDILLNHDNAIAFCHRDIGGYITTNLDKISRTKVSTEMADRESIYFLEKPKVEVRGTVSSLRLDAVLSHAFNLSRGKTQQLISAEKAFINWLTVSDTAKILKEGDIITLRGYGRIELTEILGKTKKDRIGILFYKF